MYLNNFILRLKSKLTTKPSLEFWSKHPLDSPKLVYQSIINSIEKGFPTCIARVGSVEAQVILWSQNISIPCYPIGKWQTKFSDTEKGTTNAGIRPRTRQSYKIYGDLAFKAISNIDHLAVWCTDYEASLINQSNYHFTLSEVEHFAPTMQEFQPHWIDALSGKKVLVISPFQESIQNQIPKISQIWPNRKWFIDSEFTFYKFPYLIDSNCSLNWLDVYSSIAEILLTSNYEVALFGCGGLGLPLASVAKQTGKIGIHLGGHLQLIFGIYGNRHLSQEWHRRCINSAWIRPLKNEVPSTANAVENACYW